MATIHTNIKAMDVHANPTDTVRTLWRHLGLREEPLAALNLDDLDRAYVKSSYKIAHLAQASIALCTLAVSHFHASRTKGPIGAVTVDPLHAVIEFNSEKYTWLRGELPESLWGPLSGLYTCADGHVRLHDGFINHRREIMSTFGTGCSKDDLGVVLGRWRKGEVEEVACGEGFAAYALRSEDEWAVHPQAKRILCPISISPASSPTPPGAAPSSYSLPRSKVSRKPLSGIRVVELSRVLAAPIAGRTLAWHGADVIWVSNPNLPSLPSSDRDVMRGKRHVRLDLEREEDCDRLRGLVKDADVFLQSYRPGALARRGFGPDELRRINPRLIYARGYDSLVQTATGLNVSEANAAGKGEAGRPLPCQALDHSAGYLLAAGIVTALHKREEGGEAYDVHVSLQGCMELLKALRRAEGGWVEEEYTMDDVMRFTEVRQTVLGDLRAVTHAGRIAGLEDGFDHVPERRGLEHAVWI